MLISRLKGTMGHIKFWSRKTLSTLLGRGRLRRLPSSFLRAPLPLLQIHNDDGPEINLKTISSEPFTPALKPVVETATLSAQNALILPDVEEVRRRPFLGLPSPRRERRIVTGDPVFRAVHVRH